MSSFDEPTHVNQIPSAIVGNPPLGKYYVPDAQLTPLQRNQRGIDRVIRDLDTNMETLRALLYERRMLEEQPMTYGETGNPHDACRERIGELEQELARVTAAYQQYVDGVETAEGRRIAELEREVERLRDLVRQCRRNMRELDVGGHSAQSWPDYCRDTEKMLQCKAAEAEKEEG